MSDITLTSTQRTTLLSLTQVSQLFNRTQERLNSGKKVNQVTDDAVAFFQSANLYSRSSSILQRKTQIDQSVSGVGAALTAASSVGSLLQQLEAVVQGAKGSSLSNRIAATQQFNNIGQQLAQLVKDSSYQGLNLLTSTSSSLATQFSERTAATFNISGYNLTSTATGNANSLFTQAIVAFKGNGTIVFSQVVASTTNATAGSVKGFSSLDVTGTAAGTGTVKASVAAAIFNSTINRIAGAISHINAVQSVLGTNVAILQARATFSTNYANTLQTGGDALTLADLNTEAANSQSLTLRQQLGIQSLSISSQQNSSILTLLR